MAARKSTNLGLRRVEFQVEDRPGRQIFVAGTFNGWSPCSNALKDAEGNGVYRCAMMLRPGEYQYKFVIDGEWCIDESNECFTANDLGTLNSILKVEAPAVPGKKAAGKKTGRK